MRASLDCLRNIFFSTVFNMMVTLVTYVMLFYKRVSKVDQNYSAGKILSKSFSTNHNSICLHFAKDCKTVGAKAFQLQNLKCLNWKWNFFGSAKLTMGNQFDSNESWTWDKIYHWHQCPPCLLKFAKQTR